MARHTRQWCGWCASTDDQHSHAERTTTRLRRSTTAPLVCQSCCKCGLAQKSTSMQHGTCLSQWVRAESFHQTCRGILTFRPVRALLARLWPTSLHLQKAMHPQSTFLAVAILLVFWPDCSLPMRHVCRVFQLRPLGTHPSAPTCLTARFLVLRKRPQGSDGIVGLIIF